MIRDKIRTNEAGYIATDANMQTNMFGVYSADDIKEKASRKVITADSDGAVAGYVADIYTGK